MPETTKRKTYLILALAFSLVVALGAVVANVLQDEGLRERLGDTYYILTLAIIGCVLLLLTGYLWDRSLVQRLKNLREVSHSQTDTSPADPDTDPDEVISLARNIERMARALQKTEASYRGIVEDQVDLICRCKPDGTLTFVNSAYAQAVGRRRQELVGQHFAFFQTSTGNSDYPHSFECKLEQPEGMPQRYLMWVQRPIRDNQGTLLEYQAVGHDITLRKEAEAALMRAKDAAESADRAKSEFLAIVSHEIRTPINGVIGFAQILSESNLTAEQHEQVEIIKTSGQALEKLIADILDLSKIEAGRIEIESHAFALHKCVQDTAAFFQPRVQSQGLSLNVKIESGVPEIVQADEARLRQILTNLIGNALKFTEKGGISVHVACIREKAPSQNSLLRPLRLRFAVTDTGIGIPAEKLGELFKPFSQVDSSSKRRRNGTGLGLAISKRLCELMGGDISVESTPGQGTTFRFSLPSHYEKGDTAIPFPINPTPQPKPATS